MDLQRGVAVCVQYGNSQMRECGGCMAACAKLLLGVVGWHAVHFAHRCENRMAEIATSVCADLHLCGERWHAKHAIRGCASVAAQRAAAHARVSILMPIVGMRHTSSVNTQRWRGKGCSTCAG